MKIRSNKGFTLIELLIVVAIIGIIAAIAVPGLLRARMSGNEASAIGSMRAINTAQQNYSQKCNGYAPVLTELKAAGNFLSPDLTSAASVSKSGYTVTMVVASVGTPIPTPPVGCTAPTTNYYATAAPLSIGSTGSRAFATNEAGTIFYTATGVPPVDPIPAAATPIQ
jgi:type IV pilus assembly protein PilA